MLDRELCPVDDAGWRLVDDSLVVRRTQYSARTLLQVFQELADMGAAEVGRSNGHGVRMLRPGSHPVWSMAAAAELQVAS